MKTDNYKSDHAGQLKNGPHQEFFKNGSLSAEGNFVNGEKEAEWKYYLLNGGLKAIGKYTNGQMTGKWKWYRENGQLMQTGEFDENEQKTGLWKRYYPNGRLLDEGSFFRGKPIGEWQTYDAEGTFSKVKIYK